MKGRGPTVSVLAYEGMSPFEVGIVTKVFGLPRPELDVPWYDLTVCAERPGPLRVVGGASVASERAAAGLDLCLHLVRRDHGAAVANTVARRLVVPPHREGGQAQFIEAPVPRDLDDDRITQTMSWAVANLREEITVETLSRRAHMSTRTFLRHFARCTGTSPTRWLISQRIQASLPLLEKTSRPIEEIAHTVGFISPITYRSHFVRAMRTAPSTYRRAFREPAR